MRLHPFSVLYQLLAGRGWNVMNFILSILLIAPFLVTPGSENGSYRRLLFAIAGIIFIYVMYVIWEVLYYYFFQYDLTDNHIQIRSGVFFRTEREIPLHRIQNVDINRGILQRLLGLSELRIETAGGTDTELVLQCVSDERGIRLREQLRRHRRTGSEEPQSQEEKSGGARPSFRYRLSGESYVLLCLFSLNRGVFSWFLFSIPVVLIFGLQLMPGVFLGGQFVLLLFVLLFFLFSTFAGWSAAALMTFSKYYDFSLSILGNSLQFERGLLNRRSGSIPLGKIQKLIIQENLFMRWFGFCSLEVITAGYGPGESSNREAVIPLARKPEALRVARRITSFPPLQLDHAPVRTRYRYAFQHTFLILITTAAMFLVFLVTGLNTHPIAPVRFLWLLPLSLLPGAPLTAYLKWYHLGVQLMEEYCVFRRGFWNRSTTIVPYYRVQTTISSQSIVQKYWNLRSLVVDTAGSYGLIRQDANATDFDENTISDMESTVRSRFRRSLAEHRKQQLTNRKPSRENTDASR